MKRVRRLALSVARFCVSGSVVIASLAGPQAFAQDSTQNAQRATHNATVALRGATVLTMRGPALRNATVLIRGGKIAAVGTNLTIPSDATVVDATGKYVMPGLIDAMTYFGIDAQDLAESSDPITPELRIIDAYDPTGAGFVSGGGPLRSGELLTGGVTAQYVGPGDATIVSGQGAVVKTAGKSLADITVKEPAAMDMSVGAGPTKTFRAKNRSPNTHPAVMSLLRQSLIKAQEYDRTWQTYNNSHTGAPPKRDPGMDALVRVLHRQMPARVQANTVTDIRGAMHLAEEFGFDLVINGGAQAYQMKEELAAKKIPVVLGPISHPFISGDEIPDLKEYPAPDERNAAWLRQAGVSVAIASYSHGLGGLAQPITGKWLLIDAALAQGYGLSEDEILRALTLYPAQILGVADRLGSLEAGKDADVIILDGPPLSIKTWVESVYVGGELVYQRGAGAVLAGEQRRP
ncbi:MAG TPA: amidohydrolase family protein [Gemmatimonadaceae bacterium]|nr:amidohydrolase family protein [Gemmatimonadaceae bacterium]